MAEGIDQARLDALFTAALEAAIARIEKDGTFFPLVYGAIQNVAVLEIGAIEGAQGVLDRLADVIRPRAADGTIRAAAIVRHRTDAATIEVRLRAANYAADVLVPFEIASSGLLGHQRQLTLGSFTARPAANDLF